MFCKCSNMYHVIYYYFFNSTILISIVCVTLSELVGSTGVDVLLAITTDSNNNVYSIGSATESDDGEAVHGR